MKKKPRKAIRYKSKDGFSKNIRKVVAQTKNYSLELNTPKGLDSLVHRFDQNKIGHETQKFIESSKFWQQISELSFGSTIQRSFEAVKCYRIVSGKINPLSIIGSKMHGGRFNVGTPQLRPAPEFSGVTVHSSVYGAETVECALAESGTPPPINYKAYELRSKKALMLWDLAELIKTVEWPNLKSAIEENPVGAAWVFQKVPTLSQLLAYRLRSLGGDGLFYPSTKKLHNKIYSFFIPDDVLDVADGLFTFSEVR